MVSFTDVSSNKIFYLTMSFSVSIRVRPLVLLAPFYSRAVFLPPRLMLLPLPLDHDAAAAGQHNTAQQKHTQLQTI